MPAAMHRTQLYLTASHMRRLRFAAHKHNLTISHIIRSLVEKELGDKKQEPNSTREGLVRAALRINKKGTRAPKDLSKRLDHYLYGSI